MSVPRRAQRNDLAAFAKRSSTINMFNASFAETHWMYFSPDGLPSICTRGSCTAGINGECTVTTSEVNAKVAIDQRRTMNDNGLPTPWVRHMRVEIEANELRICICSRHTICTHDGSDLPCYIFRWLA